MEKNILLQLVGMRTHGDALSITPKDSTNVSEVVDWEFLTFSHVSTQFSQISP